MNAYPVWSSETYVTIRALVVSWFKEVLCLKSPLTLPLHLPCPLPLPISLSSVAKSLLVNRKHYTPLLNDSVSHPVEVRDKAGMHQDVKLVATHYRITSEVEFLHLKPHKFTN